MGNLARTVAVSLLVPSLAGTAAAQGLVSGGFLGAAGPVGDVTGDGIDDYVEGQGALGTNSWQVHDGTTDAVVAYLTKPWASNDRYFGVGDVDGDGHDDVCWYRSSTFTSTILSGATGATLLTLANTFTTGGCDLDGDGLADLLLNTFDATGITTWIRSSRTGTPLFQISETSGSLVFHELKVMGDENGDGYEDAALITGDYVFPDTSLLRVVRGPSGLLEPFYTWGAQPCGDVDRDGAADIALSSTPTFGGAAAILAGGSHATLWVFPANLSLQGVGDMDGDGHADFVLDSTVVTSGATQLTLAGAAPVGLPVLLGDLDGDGRSECRVGLDRYEWLDPALPIASRMLRRGVPGTTSSGRKPTIVTRGHCGLGNTVWFDIRGNQPFGLVAFAIGDAANVDLAPLGAPGNASYTTLLGMQPLIADGFGLAKVTAVMPTTPSLLGAVASVQAATFDPAANALGLVTSNAIDVETRN